MSQPPRRMPAPPAAPVHSPPQSDLNTLPERVAAMRERILMAAATRDIDRLRPAIEFNETLPLFGRGEDRPRSFATVIDFLRRASFDGRGVEVLLLLEAVLAEPWIVTRTGASTTYVWPHFAVVQAPDPTPEQRLAMHRCVRFANLGLTNDIGLPLVQRIGIGADGTWHYFLAG